VKTSVIFINKIIPPYVALFLVGKSGLFIYKINRPLVVFQKILIQNYLSWFGSELEFKEPSGCDKSSLLSLSLEDIVLSFLIKKQIKKNILLFQRESFLIPFHNCWNVFQQTFGRRVILKTSQGYCFYLSI